jgi:hypothetical protein
VEDQRQANRGDSFIMCIGLQLFIDLKVVLTLRKECYLRMFEDRGRVEYLN